MTSSMTPSPAAVLLGLSLILLIAVLAVALGALSRLLAARIVRPAPAAHRELTLVDRIMLGNELVVRDLQPDSTHPVARTASRDARASREGITPADQELALAQRYYFVSSHGLR